ncbi:MAG: hypothetical protein AB1451_00670 [Nitrospirota bacterium]
MEPIVAGGAVFEYLNYASAYIGGGVSLRYAPGPWSARVRYRVESYDMTYFGATSDSVSTIITGGTLSSPFLQQVRVDEVRQDFLFDVGFQVGEHVTIAPGIRRILFENDFSSFTFAGPALGGEWTLPWRTYRFVLGLDFAANLSGKVENHAEEFLAFDGRETISFYGEPVSRLDWRAQFAAQPLDWMGFSVGYEGSVTFLEGGYRYAHGLTLGAEF